jgi:hypothetical protein
MREREPLTFDITTVANDTTQTSSGVRPLTIKN